MNKKVWQTRDFWTDTGERVANTFFQSLVASWSIGGAVSDLNLGDSALIALGASLVSLAKALAAGTVGGTGTAGLTNATISTDLALTYVKAANDDTQGKIVADIIKSEREPVVKDTRPISDQLNDELGDPTKE